MGVIKLDNGQELCRTTSLIAHLVPGNKPAPTIWKAIIDCQCSECLGQIKKDEMLTIKGNLMSRKQPVKLVCRRCCQFKTAGFHRSQ
jgi:hypothetical protein